MQHCYFLFDRHMPLLREGDGERSRRVVGWDVHLGGLGLKRSEGGKTARKLRHGGAECPLCSPTNRKLRGALRPPQPISGISHSTRRAHALYLLWVLHRQNLPPLCLSSLHTIHISRHFFFSYKIMSFC